MTLILAGVWRAVRSGPTWLWGLLLGLLFAAALVFVGDQHGAGRIRSEWGAETERRNEADREVARANRAIAAKTEIIYRDRIQKIYIKGDEIEKQVPIYITEVDSSRFAVNAGFVRLYDAAWSGESAGPAAESDREPAGISLAEVAAVEAGNATSCRAWREIAVGLREYYAHLQVITNMSE
ncbi:hypothetical protein [Collimonas humicola]|uniref:hypothetical protein n=1 Tax=Collimonas humicola TaxID=2825886 RepID=UPI001B8B1D68|nr:hypothetical protein [Collimonas humicola]